MKEYTTSIYKNYFKEGNKVIAYNSFTDFFLVLMKYLFSIILLSCCNNGFAIKEIDTNYINYYKFVNEGEYYFYKKDYTTAKTYYSKAFKIVPSPYDKDTYFYSICLWKLNKKRKALCILDTNKYTSLAMSYHKEYFNGITKKEEAKVLENNKLFIEVKTNKFKTKNKDILKLLDSLGKIDYHIRKLNESSPDTVYYYELNNIANEIFVKLDSIFKIYGYLGGYKLFSRVPLRTLMLHGPYEWYKNNKNFLLNELKKGHILPEDLATFFDRKFYINLGLEHSYFGRYKSFSDTVTANEYFKRCNEIGLSPYFNYSDLLPKYGQLPKKTKFYNCYDKQKQSFNCVKK